ncbi:MAG: hypothetical protein ABIJ61_01865, partial [bacterium]
MSNRATKPDSHENHLAVCFRWLLATIVLLQVAGIFLPNYLCWGFTFWQEFGRGLALGLLVAILVILVSPIGRGIAAALSAVGSALKKIIAILPRSVSLVLGAAVLLLIFYTLRSRALVYGDGYMVVDSFTLLDVKVELGTYFMKPLVLLWHRLWYAIISSLTSLAAADIVSLVTAAGGVVGVGAIWRIAGILSDNRRTQYLILAGGLTSAAVVLFCGYVENYTWATALGLWSLAFSLSHLESGKGKSAALLLGIVATGFHLFAAPFLLIAIVSSLNIPRSARLTCLGVGTRTLYPGIILLSLVAALVEQFTGAFDFILRLWATSAAPYAAISPRHLLDVLNELLLVAPLGVLALLVQLLGHEEKRETAPMAEQALALLALTSFLLSFWINPSLGAARDWDLLSFYGIPLSLWGVSRLARHYLKSKTQLVHILAVGLVALACLLPNLYEKINLPLATARLDAILLQDPHYQTNYGDAERCLPWGYTLVANVGESDRAEKYFHRRLAADSTGA